MRRAAALSFRQRRAGSELFHARRSATDGAHRRSDADRRAHRHHSSVGRVAMLLATSAARTKGRDSVGYGAHVP